MVLLSFIFDFKIFLFSDRALCLSFVYSMFGREMGSLRVTEVKNGLTNILFFRIGDQGSDWQSAKVDVLSDGLSKVSLSLENRIMFSVLIFQTSQKKHFLSCFQIEF